MIPEFLEYAFMQRAFAAGAITALICPAIGAFLIPRRLSLIADTLAHVALAGVAVGLVLGMPPILGAFLVTLAGAVGIERLRTRGALSGDAALAVFLSGGFAVAVVLISLARGFNADLFAILFGSILTVSPTDVWVMLGLGTAVGATVALFYPQLFAITLHEDLARTSGVPVAGLNLLLTLLTALTTVVAMRVVGVLMVSAMIVIPTLTGFALARSFRRSLVAGISTALVSVVVGLVAAYYLRLAAGGAIVLVALLILALASLPARRGGPPPGRARLMAALLAAAVVVGTPGPGPEPAAQSAACARWRTAFQAMPTRTVKLESGGRRLEVAVKRAETGEQHAAGFQCATPEEIRTNLILFDFGREILTQFHMQNVPAPLDIAFVKADGRIFSILRMEPSPTALYGPLGPFRYALEARAGFFASQGIRAGASVLVVPGSR
jgi:zinc transport system permease protein